MEKINITVQNKPKHTADVKPAVSVESKAKPVTDKKVIHGR